MRFRIGIEFEIEEASGRDAEDTLYWLRGLVERLGVGGVGLSTETIGGVDQDAKRSLLAYDLAEYGLSQSLEMFGEDYVVELAGCVPAEGEIFEGEVVAE